MKYLYYIFIGFLIGLVNYGLLLLTVRKLKKSKNISIVTISYYFRILLILLLFFLVAKNGAQNILLVLAGFLIARVVLVMCVKKEKFKV